MTAWKVAAGVLAGVAVGAAARVRRAPVPQPLRGRALTVTTPDGLRLAVEVDEPESLTCAVVFAHGWALNRHSWHFQREALAGRAMLVSYDQRGHGDSTAGPPDCCTIEQLGEDLHAVISSVVPPGLPVVVVGHSMGGMTVMGLAAARPELFGSRIAGAALVSTSSGRLAESTYGLPGLFGRLAPRVTPRVMGALRDPLITPVTTLPLTRYMAFGPSAEHLRFVNRMVAATPAAVMAGFFHGMAVHDKLAALSALGEVPTLVMVGEHDRLTPLVHSHRIAEALPSARLVVVRGAGHMLALERPSVVSAELSALLERCGQAS
ncbi:alpha/beta fold hydrolase [Nonomuraea dietziae]|uniref:Pimeloyl-ACP methyl ester carboxylesterase n=1 Tax=Nonomuraea dietziae TaxID=65515 RepID=A0A7W5YSL4_9ACTN|nr:alpha/beta hydrolase [Nonomuraea dietziae]MBB3729189.1 pimeloyl-ACP methyl ester carboxylesterase [Nonomuraea dietziae]